MVAHCSKSNGEGNQSEIELSLNTAGYFRTGSRPPIRQFGLPGQIDSTVLVRERARGIKLQGAFDKKSGRKIKKSAHAITLLPEGSKKPKYYAKRDLAVATKVQKEKIRNTNEPDKKKKRTITESTSESNSTEYRTERKKKQKKVNPRFTAELAIGNEEEVRPPVIDLTASTRTEEDSNKKKGEDQRGARRKDGNCAKPRKSVTPHKSYSKVETG